MHRESIESCIDLHEPEEEEAENAIKLAELVLKFVNSKLTLP